MAGVEDTSVPATQPIDEVYGDDVAVNSTHEDRTTGPTSEEAKNDRGMESTHAPVNIAQIEISSTLYTMTWRRIHSRCSKPRNGLFLTLIVSLSSVVYFLSQYRHTYAVTTMNMDLIEVKDVVINHTYTSELSDVIKRACVRPQLEVNNAEIMRLFSNEIHVECKAEKNWVFVDNGTFMVSKEAETLHGHIDCTYTSLLRGRDDFTWTYDKPIFSFERGTRIPTDFFNVTCSSADGVTYKNVHEAISYRVHLHENDTTKKLLPNSIGTNVLIIGLDSVSRMQWLRKLPLMTKLLQDEFGAVILKGMNVMGDGTPAAMFPMLTGKTEKEHPESRRKIKGAVPLDDFPFIWKKFKNIGYITQMAEDYSDVGTFTLRLRGFNTQPTDHYSRPYYLVTEEGYSSKPKPHCTASEPNIIVDFRWINDTYRMYPNKLKFMFNFFSGYTHSKGRVLFNHVDVEMSKFLRNLKAEGHLNNTILIVMSDHGSRFDYVRETAQGKHEQRLPFVSVTFPEWFKAKYPEAYTNVQKNSNGLTTVNDLHEMLLDIVDFRTDKVGDLTKRGISLFREIPVERTCTNAGIADHWCACLNWVTVSLSDEIIERIAGEAIKFFNELLAPASEYCEHLSLKEITKAHQLIRNDYDKVVKSRGTPDKSKAQIVTYELSLTTGPNDGHFELSVLYDTVRDKISFDSHSVSRTNKYGEDSRCIMETFTQLRTFCKCKSK